MNGLQCDKCGKFMTQLDGSSWVFVPDSEVSYEENKTRCVSCTQKYGVPIPNQNVNWEVCTGIIGRTKTENYMNTC